MGFMESIRLALTALAANKMRSLLTMLGIIIGISAVITITTIGNSIQQTLSNTFNQVSMNYFYVMLMNKPIENEDESEDEDDFNYSLNYDDVISDDMLNELLETYPDQFKIVSNEFYSVAETLNHNNQYVNTLINGITDGYIEQIKVDIISGRNITNRDNNEKKHTAVVSDIFVKQYFPEGVDPLGETISFTVESGESQEFTVIGVYEYSESKMGSFEPGTKEKDKQTPVFIPFSTAKKLNGSEDNGYNNVVILWNTDYEMSEVENNLNTFFEEKYAHNKYWTIYIENEQSMLDMINKVLNIITIAISIIAAISLIVGGVGVMNIMLVSIIERTKEIGVRKALGAQNSAIRLQFVVESIIICLIGGIIGIILGIINGVVIGEVTSSLVTNFYKEYMSIISITVSPSIPAIVVAVIFSMLIGIFFGYYPANKAAKMNPIDALRYE